MSSGFCNRLLISLYGVAVAVNTMIGDADEQGTPLMGPFLEVLTTCSTVDEAMQVLTGSSYLTGYIVGVSDADTAAVLEIGGKSQFQRRDPNNGWLAVTNHANPVPNDGCWRYAALHQRLSDLEADETFTITDSISLLGAVALNGSSAGGEFGPSTTLCSVVFQPQSRELHLSIRGIPATSGKFVSFTLDELFNR